MTAAKRPRQTRQRILDCALELFNARGAPNVTTGHIAEELGISPGNLYYHFRNKDAIVAPLFEALEAEHAEALALPEGRALNVEDLWFQLHLVFEAIWRYRFIYRDLTDLLAANPRLAGRFRAQTGRSIDAAKAVFAGLIAAGELAASRAETDALALNITLIATYWMSFEHARRKAGYDEADIGRGVFQVMAAIAPFLLGESRKLLERLAADYL